MYFEVHGGCNRLGRASCAMARHVGRAFGGFYLQKRPLPVSPVARTVVARAMPQAAPPVLAPASLRCFTSLTHREIMDLLKHLDADSDGMLSPVEFKEALRLLRVPVAKSTLGTLVGSQNVPRGHPVSYQECVQFIDEQRDVLMGVFQQFDVGRDGRISEGDLKLARATLGLKISDDDIKKLIARTDSNQDGAVEFDEFCTMLLSADSIHVGGVFEHWIQHAMLETGEYGPPPEEEVDTPTWIHFLAGAIAGGVSRTATAPMDRLKTLLQAQGAHAAMANGVRVTGVIHCAKEIVKEGGARAFWRGNGINVMKIAPETACKFWAYDYLKALMHVDDRPPTVVERLASGGLAGAFAQLVVYPMEVLKTRMALAGSGDYRGVYDCARTTVRTEGAAGLYRGLFASLVGILPYSAVDLTVYSLLKELYSKHYSDNEPGVGTLLCCGAVSTTCGQLCTYPLQLVRTRLQAQGMKGRPVVFLGIRDCVFKTVKHDGLRGLYKGILPNFMKSLPAISLSYTVYELSKRWLTEVHRQGR